MMDQPGQPDPEFDRLKGETLEELNAADRAAGIDPGPLPPPPPSTGAPLGSGGRRTLVRDPQSRYLAGVASGLAYYLNVDVTIVRVGFVVVLVLSGFLPAIIMYEVAAFLIPKAAGWPPVPGVPSANRDGRPRSRARCIPRALAFVVFGVASVWVLRAITGSSVLLQVLVATGLVWAAFQILNQRSGPVSGALGPYQPVPPGTVGRTSTAARVRRSAVGRLTIMSAALFFSGATALAVLVGSGLTADIDLNDLQLGERAFAPATIADLPDNTRLDAGSIRIDLSEMTFEPGTTSGAEPHRLDLSVTAGEIVIVLAEDQPIQVNPVVEKGSLSVSPGAQSVPSPALIVDATVRYGDLAVTYAD